MVAHPGHVKHVGVVPQTDMIPAICINTAALQATAISFSAGAPSIEVGLLHAFDLRWPKRDHYPVA